MTAEESARADDLAQLRLDFTTSALDWIEATITAHIDGDYVRADRRLALARTARAAALRIPIY